MKKGNNYIKTLIIISALALVGLICIQSYWMLIGIEQQKKHHQDIIKLSLAEIVQELEKHDKKRNAEIDDNLNPSLGVKNLEPSIANKINEIIEFQDSLIKENNFEISKTSSQRNLQLKNLYEDFSSLIFLASIEDRISKKNLNS